MSKHLARLVGLVAATGIVASVTAAVAHAGNSL